jgi:hypothetical protein
VAGDLEFSFLMAVSSIPIIFGGRVLSRKDSGPCCLIMLIFCWWKQKIILKKEVPMFDLDIFDWMIIGPLSEELADEEKERRRLEDDIDQDDEE